MGAERFIYGSHAEERPSTVVAFCEIPRSFAFRVCIDSAARIDDRVDLPPGGFDVVICPDVEIGDDAIVSHDETIDRAKPGRSLLATL